MKYIPTQEFNKLTGEKFTAILKQANGGTKDYIVDFTREADFYNEIKKFNKKVSSNKIKHVLV